MIGYVLINPIGFPIVYGQCNEADLENQAREGLTVHAISAHAGMIDPSIQSTTTVRDMDGNDWPIDPPFSL